MPKPASKQELLIGNAEAFNCLIGLIDSLTSEESEMEFPFQRRDRNIRDVLAHLLKWQQMLFEWYKVGMAGGKPEMPAKGFTWKLTPQLNQKIWENCQSQSLKLVRTKLLGSHEKLQKWVQTHSDAELFTKRFYAWTGSTSLGLYLTAAGWSHYRWAAELIRKFVKHVTENRTQTLKHEFFSTPQAFQKWFFQNHATATELLVGFWKTGSGKPCMTWPEAVDEALCFGWIDGVRKSLDQQSYTIRFTPRRPKSIWSSVNIKRVEVLKAEGRMQPGGLEAFERRTQDKSSIYSYEQRTVDLPEPYAGQLRKNKRAKKFFERQTASYRKAACWWVISAKKEETRMKRAEMLIELSEQEKLIPQFRPHAPKKK